MQVKKERQVKMKLKELYTEEIFKIIGEEKKKLKLMII